jgi:hypothetical protein
MVISNVLPAFRKVQRSAIQAAQPGRQGKLPVFGRCAAMTIPIRSCDGRVPHICAVFADVGFRVPSPASPATCNLSPARPGAPHLRGVRRCGIPRPPRCVTCNLQPVTCPAGCPTSARCSQMWDSANPGAPNSALCQGARPQCRRTARAVRRNGN